MLYYIGFSTNLDEYIVRISRPRKFLPFGELLRAYRRDDITYEVYKVRKQWLHLAEFHTLGGGGRGKVPHPYPYPYPCVAKFSPYKDLFHPYYLNPPPPPSSVWDPALLPHAHACVVRGSVVRSALHYYNYVPPNLVWTAIYEELKADNEISLYQHAYIYCSERESSWWPS